MALAGGMGVRLDAPPAGIPAHAWWYGEDQARYVIATSDPAGVQEDAKAAGIPLRKLGESAPRSLTLEGAGAISLDELRAIHEGWLPKYMS